MNPAPVKGALVGTVMDTAHDPLEGATVFIRDPQRQARTNILGRFQLDSLAPGTYELTVRHIGHDVAVQSYVVTDSGGIARFCLVPDPHGLAPVITAVKRGGLSGFVGDSAYNMVADAEIRAVAGGARAITDSAGGFFLALKPGAYALVVKKAGYGSQLFSVTVPADSGRQVAIWLSAPAKNARRIAAAIEDSLKFRLMFAHPARARLLSSEDIMRNPSFDVTATVSAAAIQPIWSGCEAVIDGGPFTLPLGLIDKSEIAAMEVYVEKPRRSGVTSIDPRGASSASGSATACGVRVYVWLK